MSAFMIGTVLLALCFLGFQHHSSHHRRLLATENEEYPSNRLLYIVTSVHEFDIGRRETTEGYNRFSKTLVPVVRDAVASMIESGYNVDVYLITHYKLSNERHDELLSQLPDSVGLQLWDNASPIAYEYEYTNMTVSLHTRGLARQHRYVIKDKIFYYDVFVNFEDDMLVRGPHVSHFVNLTQQLYDWRLLQKERNSQGTRTTAKENNVTRAVESFYGPMTVQQLRRTLPGFLRVETALPDFVPRKRNRFDQIPVTMDNNSVDPSVCCHVASAFNEHIVPTPSANDLYMWETSIDALGIRQLPNEDDDGANENRWVLLLGGSNSEIWEYAEYVIGDYWSGRAPGNYFPKKKRPDRKLGRYISNQGGWMATRRQIVEWHEQWCRGNFLPPYDLPFFPYDGLDLRTVEYWSGGIQLVGVNSCNLQRIVSLDPQGFSSSLLLHTSNNKQRQRAVQKQFAGRHMNDFWGQLNTIKHAAEAEMKGQKERES